jgi:hypothetical protein
MKSDIITKKTTVKTGKIASKRKSVKKNSSFEFKNMEKKHLPLLLILSIALFTGVLLLKRCDETGKAIDYISANITNILSKKNSVKTAGIQDSQCQEKAYSGEIKVSAWYEKNEEGYYLRISDNDLQKLPGFDNSEKFKTINSTLILVDATEKIEEKLKEATKKEPTEITLKGYGKTCDGNPLVSIKTGEKILKNNLKTL